MRPEGTDQGRATGVEVPDDSFRSRPARCEEAPVPQGCNESGDFFTYSALRLRFWAIRNRCGITKSVSLYGYRHRFVTDWLVAGKSIGCVNGSWYQAEVK